MSPAPASPAQHVSFLAGFGLRRRAGLGALFWLYALPALVQHRTVFVPSQGSQNIYVARAIVTGTDERDRPRGLAICLGQVLVNVSGDPNILARPGVPALEARATSMVTGLDYVDRMSGMHKHDEQGTRDRPFTLTATFAAGKVIAALAAIGAVPWKGPRPTVFLAVAVHGFTGNFALTAGSPLGYDMPQLMRAAIADAAWQYKLPVMLPANAGAPAPAGALAVRGTLVWSDTAHGWIATWRSGDASWGARGVSFDDAFRVALAGALGIASGHGPPRPSRCSSRRC
jgi:hypothetical protein